MIQGNLLVIAIIIFVVLFIGLVMIVLEFKSQTPTQPVFGESDAGTRKR